MFHQERLFANTHMHVSGSNRFRVRQADAVALPTGMAMVDATAAVVADVEVAPLTDHSAAVVHADGDVEA